MNLNSLLTLIAALGPGSLFGLATFSHKLGLYDVQGPIPVVKNVFIPPETEGSLPIELEDVMPLLQFLAPVCWPAILITLIFTLCIMFQIELFGCFVAISCVPNSPLLYDQTLVSEINLVTLSQVETCKERIGSALETLRPTTSWERTTAAGQGVDGVLMGGRGFGVAIEALLNYLGSEYGSTFALGRW